VEFAAGSSVSAVCKYCNTTLRRSDRGVENLGKLADLADTPTMVAVGDSGTLAGQGFVVLGRVQLQHDLGGVWDEWYLGFQGGRWGWLAYAQGNYYATWKLEPPPPVPTMRELRLEGPVSFGQSGVFRVVELKQATIASAEGELPFAPRTGQVRYYADLVGPRNGFATIDWGEGSTPPEVFLGWQMPESGLAITQRSERPRKQIDLEGLKCPGCGAPLKVTAGNRIERIACKHCGTISESASQQIIARQSAARAEPLIALGASGPLQGATYTVIGFVQRSTVIDGETFHWTEYLLFSPGIGFRWLVDDEGIWRFVSPLNVAEVDLGGFPASVRVGGQTFTQRNSNIARVDYVLGEFYWKVQVGESVQVTDLQSGSVVVSREAMQNEVAWSYAPAVAWAEIAAAFNVQRAPPPVTAAAAPTAATGWSTGAIIVLVLIVVVVLPCCILCASVCDGSGSSSGSTGGVRGGGVTGGGWSGGK
jgi:hypothetical protein